METLVNQIHNSLLKNRKSLAVAESCTGGLLSSLLTQLSGSSRYFILGIVAYSNKAKTALLKIPASVILKEGAVSKVSASLMAKNVRRIAGADFGIGITGIAGPTGAGPLKPVGTVFIGIARKNRLTCQRFHFTGSRTTVRRKATQCALLLLLNYLKKSRSA